MSTTLPLDTIRLDGGTQPRAGLDEPVVQEYAEAIREGAMFPAVTVYYDGDAYWLADGFHRYHAARHVGQVDITAEVRRGTRREAVLHAVGANATHGLRRTNADKRRAVLTLLDDTEWAGWSDSKIGQLCKVDHKTVAKYRLEYLGNSQDSTTRTVERGGQVYTMDTGNIGDVADRARLHEHEAKIEAALADMRAVDGGIGEILQEVAAALTPEQYREHITAAFGTDSRQRFMLQVMADQGLPTAQTLIAELGIPPFASSVPVAVSKVAVRVASRRRLNQESVQSLAESIKEVGLMHPILVTPDLRLIAGWHRLEAVRRLGWHDVDAYVLDVSARARELVASRDDMSMDEALDLIYEEIEIDDNLSAQPLNILERGELEIRRDAILARRAEPHAVGAEAR